MGGRAANVHLYDIPLRLQPRMGGSCCCARDGLEYPSLHDPPSPYTDLRRNNAGSQVDGPRWSECSPRNGCQRCDKPALVVDGTDRTDCSSCSSLSALTRNADPERIVRGMVHVYQVMCQFSKVQTELMKRQQTTAASDDIPRAIRADAASIFTKAHEISQRRNHAVAVGKVCRPVENSPSTQH